MFLKKLASVQKSQKNMFNVKYVEDTLLMQIKTIMRHHYIPF